MEFLTWAAMVEVPLFAALFRMVGKNRRETEDKFSALRNECSSGLSAQKECLAEFKLHVARNYVSVTYLKDVETRLTNHLLRIEKKLDDVGKQP